MPTTDGASQFYGFAAARSLPGRRTLYTFHRSEMGDTRDRSDVARNRLLDWLTDRYVFVSQARRDFYCQRNRLSTAKAQVIHNGVDIDYCRSRAAQGLACRARLGLEPSTILLASVGALQPVKGLDLLLQSLPKVIKWGHRLHLAVAGEGPQRPQLEALIRELGLERWVTLLGYRDDAQDWINACDIFVMTPRAEAFGLVFIEAMACGKPVVASRVGASPRW